MLKSTIVLCALFLASNQAVRSNPIHVLRFLLLQMFPSRFLTKLQSYLDYDGWLSITLYHALDTDAPDTFTFRGNATITNLNTGSFTVTQDPLTRAERNQLKRLAERDGFYQIKAAVVAADGSQSQFLTSSKAVSLFDWRLQARKF